MEGGSLIDEVRISCFHVSIISQLFKTVHTVTLYALSSVSIALGLQKNRLEDSPLLLHFDNVIFVLEITAYY